MWVVQAAFLFEKCPGIYIIHLINKKRRGMTSSGFSVVFDVVFDVM